MGTAASRLRVYETRELNIATLRRQAHLPLIGQSIGLDEFSMRFHFCSPSSATVIPQ